VVIRFETSFIGVIDFTPESDRKSPRGTFERKTAPWSTFRNLLH
jgi:hypothetical protein